MERWFRARLVRDGYRTVYEASDGDELVTLVDADANSVRVPMRFLIERTGFAEHFHLRKEDSPELADARLPGRVDPHGAGPAIDMAKFSEFRAAALEAVLRFHQASRDPDEPHRLYRAWDAVKDVSSVDIRNAELAVFSNSRVENELQVLVGLEMRELLRALCDDEDHDDERGWMEQALSFFLVTTTDGAETTYQETFNEDVKFSDAAFDGYGGLSPPGTLRMNLAEFLPRLLVRIVLYVATDMQEAVEELILGEQHADGGALATFRERAAERALAPWDERASSFWQDLGVDQARLMHETGALNALLRAEHFPYDKMTPEVLAFVLRMEYPPRDTLQRINLARADPDALATYMGPLLNPASDAGCAFMVAHLRGLFETYTPDPSGSAARATLQRLWNAADADSRRRIYHDFLTYHLRDASSQVYMAYVRQAWMRDTNNGRDPAALRNNAFRYFWDLVGGMFSGVPGAYETISRALFRTVL